MRVSPEIPATYWAVNMQMTKYSEGQTCERSNTWGKATNPVLSVRSYSKPQWTFWGHDFFNNEQMRGLENPTNLSDSL